MPAKSLPSPAQASRRGVVLSALGVAAAVSPLAAAAAPSVKAGRSGAQTSSTITTKDGTRIFYKDWGEGPIVTFSHGWPLNADAWDAQMLFLVNQGYRVIAHDRRSHGRSDQTAHGNDMDTYADDLEQLLTGLDVRGAVMVGHSTGGGEVARYIGRHGSSRVSKAVLIGAVPPIMLKTPANPGGLPMSVFDGLRAGVIGNRAAFYRGLAVPFFGFNLPGATPDQATLDAFWLQGMTGGIKGQYDCIKQFSETDFTQDLKAFDAPTLFIHGDADQIVPIADAAQLASKIVKTATLKIYPGAPHGLCVTQSDKVNADLLAFLKS